VQGYCKSKSYYSNCIDIHDHASRDAIKKS
jgi:hypothetical protein